MAGALINDPTEHRLRGVRLAWFTVLVVAICFEGLGRKVLPEVPSVVFYFAKDVLLVAGAVVIGFSPRASITTRTLMSGFWLVIGAAVGWTILESFNPAQPSLPLAVIGLRGYWLWWLAPPLVASALQDPESRRRATWLLTFVAAVVGVYAAIQFASPADSAINAYATFGGEKIVDVAAVGTTGRARVASTFSYLSGFTNFTIIVPPILVGVGMDTPDRRLRVVSLVVAAAVIGAIPMSGSRAPLLLAMASFALFASKAGLFRSSAGRRVIGAALVAGAIAFVSTPDAVQGLEDRFRGADTATRLWEYTNLLPPVAIAENDYAVFGDGTGTQQNARLAFGVELGRKTESEPSRLLAELGVIGYLLVWAAKAGLAIALLRAAAYLKRREQPGMAGTAAAFALFAFIGNAAFDHVWQALFFVGVGIVLATVTWSASSPNVGHVAESGAAERGTT
jgi:hypothetical protein